MTHLGVGGQLSLEGDLSKLDASMKLIGSSEESSKLRRHTISPRQDFVILPLDDESIQLIEKRVLHLVGLRSRVIHVQIEQAGKLVFGSYDNFHRDCVWVSEVVGVDLLERMVTEFVLRSFKRNPHDVG